MPANQKRLRDMLLDKNITNVAVPKTYDELCTRRLLVSQWIDGKKLSECSKEKIAEVTPAAQEAFLMQLFEVGFFHAGEFLDACVFFVCVCHCRRNVCR